jgi:hypothetical protein
MSFSVNDFRSQLVGDGARPNLFEIFLSIPEAIAINGAAAAQKATVMAKSGQLPGSSIGTVSTYYFGREVKIPGNRSFPDWSITVINDEDFLIRNTLENWMNSLNSHAGNLRNPSAVNNSSYSLDSLVYQYGKTGDIIKAYKFVGMYPIDISPIDLSWENNNSIEEYSVTLAYQWWESVPVPGQVGQITT